MEGEARRGSRGKRASSSARRQEAFLRTTRESRGETAGSREGHAQAGEGFQAHRQAHAPHRFDGEGHRQGAVRPRREAPEPAHRGRGAPAGLRRAREVVQSRQGEERAGRDARGAGLQWRRGGRAEFLGGEEGPRCARGGMGSRSQCGALERGRWAASIARRRRRQARSRGSPATPRRSRARRRRSSRNTRCPSSPTHQWSPQLHCGGASRRRGDLGRLAIPDRRPGRGGENARAAALAGAAQHDARGRPVSAVARTRYPITSSRRARSPRT